MAENFCDIERGQSILDDLVLKNEMAESDLDSAREVVQTAIETASTDPTAHLKKEVMAAFRLVRDHDALEYEVARTAMKKANRLIRMEALDGFTRGESDGESDGHTSAATALAQLASARCELWSDPDGNGFASFDRDHEGKSHREHWRLESTGFRDWLAWLAHTEVGQVPSSETLKSACNALSGKAKFDGEEQRPATRVAKTDAGFWVDCGNESWQAILVTQTGWKIVDKPPVRFTRNKSMRPLPVPSTDGDVQKLWPLVNVPVEDRPLVLAWILESLRPDTPYPVLELIGEQGSAKSTTQKVLRQFVDPNKVMLRGRPKTIEDVFTAAGNAHVISLENLSGITPELSDALCTISTGGGQAGRQLFTNGEEHIIEAHNPIMLNGIGAVVTRPDLLDRTVALCLPTIRSRATETELEAAVEKNAPSIMGGLLDLFAKTLAGLDDVRIDPADRPRMADFAILGEAMHRATGGAPGEWLAMYQAHRKDAIRRTVDASPVAQACIDFVESGLVHRGTVKSLLEALNSRNASNQVERGDYWPKSPKGLGDALRRAAPALRQIGIQLAVDSKPRRDGVHCELRRSTCTPLPAGVNIEGSSSPSSQPSQEREVFAI